MSLRCLDLCELLDRGADVTRRDEHGLTALHVAVREGYPSIVQKLIENGADPNTKTPEHDTALALARKRLAAQSGRTDAWGLDFIQRCSEIIDILEASTHERGA